MRLQRKTKAVIGAAAVFSLSLGVAGTASADYAPSSTDVVGVGGDTPQFTVDFLADGNVAGDLGYNAANNVNKWAGFNATSDTNGRNSFGKNSATPLNPTVQYRAGTSPVQRNQSSGDAIKAIIADTGSVHTFDFIASARAPKASEQAQALAAPNVGTLRVVQVADDGVEIGAATVTNAPANLTVNDLLKIYTGVYTKWNDIPGNAAGSSATIVPGIPPTSSAINNALINALKAENGGVAPVLSASVQTIEQNDASVIAGNPNFITPISTARLNLWASGTFFKDPNVLFPGGSPLPSPIKAVTGWSTTNQIFFIYRESDQSSTKPFQPGSTKNFAKTLFADSAPGAVPFVKSPGGQALIASAGDVPNYADKGPGYSVG